MSDFRFVVGDNQGYAHGINEDILRELIYSNIK